MLTLSACSIVYVYTLNDDQTTNFAETLLPPNELAVRIPRARIVLFGYDTRAYSYGYRLKDALDCHTQWLLDNLIKIRPKAYNKPRLIIFITGDLGGLIVKKALIKSNSVAVSYSETIGQTESIIVLTVRVVFLRSPTEEDALNSSHLKSLSN